MNFLEQLVAEWYEYQGYFVRANVKFGRLTHGGYEGEMDVVAYDPKEKILVHLETSTGAYSLKKREERFRKKFETAQKYYEELFPVEFREVERIAIDISKPRTPVDLGEEVVLISISELFTQITKKLSKTDPTKKAVPERYPLLRAIQFAVWYGISRKKSE